MRMKRQTTDWEEIFPDHLSDKGFIPRICKEPSKLWIRDSTTRFFQWARDLKSYLTKDGIWVTDKQVKRRSILLAVRETQTNAQWDATAHLLERPKSGRLTVSGAGETWGAWISQTLPVGMQNGTNTLGNRLAVSYKVTYCTPTIWSSHSTPDSYSREEVHTMFIVIAKNRKQLNIHQQMNW